MTSGQQERKSKQRKIRNSEYYDMEGTFDRLYAESKKDKTFNHLMEIIESEENIKLAYRTIKKNTGSDTSGVDKRTIADLAKLSEEEYVRLIRKQFSNYHPRPVRRVEIPKPNGKTRPLGIPTIVDRIVQQCILQVMEPICEAKFSENSNGFRSNRSAETAIAQCMRLIQVQHLYHVVDLDIKGFFDNISHTKLIRQIWALGIRDKKLLCIIKEMLKAPVVLPNGKKTYPARGTPQGGILSPLLANIILNELDWWIASQWEQMPTKTKFKTRSNAQGTEIKSHAYRALRRSRLKEMHAVRYADAQDETVTLLNQIAADAQANNEALLSINERPFYLVPSVPMKGLTADENIKIITALIVSDEIYSEFVNSDTCMVYWNFCIPNELVETKGLMLPIMEARDLLKPSGLYYESYLNNFGRQLFYVISGSYTTLYMGFMFLIIACALLALQFLTQMQTTKSRYLTLSILGARREQIKRSINQQVLWYFLLPLILACISGAVGIYAMQLYLYSGAAHLEQSYPLLIAMAVIVVLVMVIYGVAVARTANREIGKLNYKPNS